MDINMETEKFYENYMITIRFRFDEEGEEIEFDDRDNFDKNGKSSEPRKCRFCNCIEGGEHSFKKVAHAIPELLGNKKIFTQNECDRCNNISGSTYETALGNYLSVLRALLRIPGKKSQYKYKNNNDNLINEIKFRKEEKLEITSTIGSDGVEINEDKREVKFNLPRYSYVPFEVYQSFMKIFLSVLPKQYLEDANFVKIILNFNELYKYSNQESNILRKVILEQAKAIALFVPGPALSELIILKKKNDSFEAPDFIFIIRIFNKAFQFCIQKLSNKSRTVEVPSFFNVFVNDWIECSKINKDEVGLPKQWIENFSSLEKCTHSEKITFSCTSIEKKQIED
jgi:hypothetical protein